jgi:hypothetical protein
MTDSDRPADLVDSTGVSDTASWVLTGPDGKIKDTSEGAAFESPSEEDDDDDAELEHPF